jgi:hypothetical protein
VSPVGRPAVQNRERARVRADRGADLEQGRHTGAVERRGPQKPVRARPCLDAPAQDAARTPAQSPPARAFRSIRTELEPLDPHRQGDRTRGPLSDHETHGGFPRARTRQRHVIDPGRATPSRERQVELVLREAVGVEEGCVGSARPPPRAQIRLVERDPCAVRGDRPERCRTRVPQFERGPRGARKDSAEEKRRRDEPHRARRARRSHRSTTVSARLPLLEGLLPSGIVSARTT